jgi:hypothetical protein
MYCIVPVRIFSMTKLGRVYSIFVKRTYCVYRCWYQHPGTYCTSMIPAYSNGMLVLYSTVPTTPVQQVCGRTLQYVGLSGCFGAQTLFSFADCTRLGRFDVECYSTVYVLLILESLFHQRGRLGSEAKRSEVKDTPGSGRFTATDDLC